MARNMKRLTLEEYHERFKLFSHSSEYTILSKFKLFTQNCLVYYCHITCGTKFHAKPALFERKESLCPVCYPSKDESSTTIENIPWERAPKVPSVKAQKRKKRAIWLEKRAAKDKSRVHPSGKR